MATSASKSCSVIGREPRWRYEGQIKKCYKSEREYVAFLSIPYAKVPAGSKRYQAPESLTSVEPTNFGERTPATQSAVSTYKANRTQKICTQLKRSSSCEFVGSSDCLYLNIFLPRDPALIKERLPVLVFIHGGGFGSGSNNPEIYSPESIVQYELVFVTMNYRLGLLGFLNMHTRHCPGNAGLKDQVKALEWIRDNIECFKGDPNNVTISGCSAGATCVNLHLVTPASKDLFHKAIVQSGGIYSTWGYRGHRYEQSNVLLTDETCRKFLSASEDSRLGQKLAHRLLITDRRVRHPHSVSPLFGPSVEQYKEGAFITDDIEKMMEKVDHDKPVMAGITKGEGIDQFVFAPGPNYVQWVNDDLKFRQFLMDNFRWSEGTAASLADEIRNKYFPNRHRLADDDMNRCFVKLLRDLCFRRFYDNFKFGPHKKVHQNLYVYRFDHCSEICAVRRHRLNFNDPTHEDELRYLYCPSVLKRIYEKYIYEGPNQNKTIQAVMNHMCSLWANFCKTGIPRSNFDPKNVEWRRHTEENPCYLSISKNLRLKEESLFEADWAWLNQLVDAEPTVRSPLHSMCEQE